MKTVQSLDEDLTQHVDESDASPDATPRSSVPRIELRRPRRRRDQRWDDFTDLDLGYMLAEDAFLWESRRR